MTSGNYKLKVLLVALMAWQFMTGHGLSSSRGSRSLAVKSDKAAPMDTAAKSAKMTPPQVLTVDKAFQSGTKVRVGDTVYLIANIAEYPRGNQKPAERPGFEVNDDVKVFNPTLTHETAPTQTEAESYLGLLLVPEKEADRNCRECSFIIDLSVHKLTALADLVNEAQVNQVYTAIGDRAREKKAEFEAKKKEQEKRDEQYAKCEIDKDGKKIKAGERVQTAKCWGEQLALYKNEPKSKDEDKSQSGLKDLFEKFEEAVNDARKANLKAALEIVRGAQKVFPNRDLSKKRRGRQDTDTETNYGAQLEALELSMKLDLQWKRLLENADSLKDEVIDFWSKYQTTPANPTDQFQRSQSQQREYNLLSQKYQELLNQVNKVASGDEMKALQKLGSSNAIDSSDVPGFASGEYGEMLVQTMNTMFQQPTTLQGIPSANIPANTDYTGYNPDRVNRAGGAPPLNFPGANSPAPGYSPGWSSYGTQGYPNGFPSGYPAAGGGYPNMNYPTAYPTSISQAGYPAYGYGGNPSLQYPGINGSYPAPYNNSTNVPPGGAYPWTTPTSSSTVPVPYTFGGPYNYAGNSSLNNGYPTASSPIYNNGMGTGMGPGYMFPTSTTGGSNSWPNAPTNSLITPTRTTGHRAY